MKRVTSSSSFLHLHRRWLNIVLSMPTKKKKILKWIVKNRAKKCHLYYVYDPNSIFAWQRKPKVETRKKTQQTLSHDTVTASLPLYHNFVKTQNSVTFPSQLHQNLITALSQLYHNFIITHIFFHSRHFKDLNYVNKLQLSNDCYWFLSFWWTAIATADCGLRLHDAVQVA